MFLANYTDGLSDVHLPHIVNTFVEQQAVATFVSVRPSQSFHAVRADADGIVRNLTMISEADLWMNGGFFVLSQDIFNYIHDGEDLVNEPFAQLIALKRLGTHRHEGFWSCMDTFKEKQVLDEVHASDHAPWEVWTRAAIAAPRALRCYDRTG